MVLIAGLAAKFEMVCHSILPEEDLKEMTLLTMLKQKKSLLATTISESSWP